MARRLRVGVVFGGRSGEHEVSLASAYGVMTNLDPERFEVVPIGIAKDGGWLLGGDAWPRLRAAAKLALGPGEDQARVPRAVLDAEVARAAALAPAGDGVLAARPEGALGQLDVVFPVLHGPFGEDGTVQGLLELADLPYVGAGVTASALAMDKVQTKRVLTAAGLAQCAWREVRRVDFERDPAAVQQALAPLGWPVFIKPANLGSSVGITKAGDDEQLARGLRLAARYDRRLIVEAAVPNAREIEVSVLGNDEPEASVCGEIVPSSDFYDFEAKYVLGTSALLIPAPLPPALAEEIRALALAAYRTLDLAGLSRVDFLLERDTDRVYLNEVNTLPGFTPISMYPKLWAASGLPYRELLSRLIDLAIARHHDKSRSVTSV